ncbi:MAG: family NAD(P)-dependent oxidoreductase [Microbacteriaceae bacterium]|jgi:short-subunit dehydrogenase|nr:family NAD(P)-dependent oxidoreductase [Microbacteriaceae bacterium]
MPIALITGASAGLGAEFARQLAAQGYDLVLTARDRTRLDALATTLPVNVEVIPADLLSPTGLALVEARAGDAVRPIDLLVNNAGFGLQKSFAENSIDDEVALAEMLIVVPLRLTHAALSQMLPRASGTIVIVASVAGYTPRETYGAAKTWVLSFSRWANAFYRSRGITVSAIAPGFTRTEFHSRMGITSVDDVPGFLWLKAETVVRVGLRDVARGKAISIPTARYKLAVALASVLPTSLVVRMAARGR